MSLPNFSPASDQNFPIPLAAPLTSPLNLSQLYSLSNCLKIGFSFDISPLVDSIKSKDLIVLLIFSLICCGTLFATLNE